MKQAIERKPAAQFISTENFDKDRFGVVSQAISPILFLTG